MDDRLKILEERKKKMEEIKIAKRADKLMLEGGTDSDSSFAVITNDGNATRQLYHAIGHETLQSVSEDYCEQTDINKQSLPYHDNKL